MKRRKFIHNAGMFMFASSVNSNFVGAPEFINIGRNKNKKTINVGVLLPEFEIWQNGVNEFKAQLSQSLPADYILNFAYFSMEQVAAYKQRLRSGKLDLGISGPSIWDNETDNAATIFNGFFSGKSPLKFQAWLNSGGQNLWEKAYKNLNLTPYLFSKSPGLTGAWSNTNLSDSTGIKTLIFNSSCPMLARNLQCFGAQKLSNIKTNDKKSHLYELVCTHIDYAEKIHQRYPYYYSLNWSQQHLWTSYNLEMSFYTPYWQALPTDIKNAFNKSQIVAERSIMETWGEKDLWARSQIVKSGVELKDFPAEFIESANNNSSFYLREYMAKSTIKNELISDYVNFG